LIASDHRSASILTASALALAILLARPAAARGDEPAAAVPAPATSVVVQISGETDTISTQATTVAELLTERHIRVAQDDFVSVPLDTPLADGMKIVYRPAQTLAIYVDSHEHLVRSAAETVRDLLAEQRIAFGPHDEVKPGLNAAPQAQVPIRIARVDMWTVQERTTIAPALRQHDDANLAAGTIRTLDRGTPGLRETTFRLVRRGDAKPSRIVLASRIIRAPRARVVARGIAEYSSFAAVAQRGFTSALHLAGTALHMIATAYTAGCYGCSGLTATGARAGFGVIAVDPSVIPLGTKLFIPGYGRAVAGDTGGAIRGHRVDLGMDTLSEALRFGRRPVTVYILR
jgi:uncharacterized protein YabE (DUF348 family)